MTKPTPPVPPDDSSVTINLADHGGEELATRLIFEAGYKQAIPEREELAALLAELANALRWNVPEAWDWPVPPGVSILHDRARAAAERLRGGGSDG